MDGSSHSQVSEMALGSLHDKGEARLIGLPLVPIAIATAMRLSCYSQGASAAAF